MLHSRVPAPHGFDPAISPLFRERRKLKTNTRVDDIIGRYGGDEFLLLLPDTELKEARAIAGRLCRTAPVKMSCGVATSLSPHDTLPDLITACDERLYRHKAARRLAPPSRDW